MGLFLLALCLACKPVPPATAEDQTPVDRPVGPVRPPLPPGEEYVPGPTADAQALAMAAPLTPPPGTHLIGESGEEENADLRAYEANVRFHRGETVDMNGNGKPDHFGRWVGGVFTFTIDKNEDGKPDTVSDGSTVKMDTDLDGRWDVVETDTRRPTNNGPKFVREKDTDKDGILDERYTEEFLAPTKRAFKTEKRNAEGVWETTERWTGPEYDLDKRSDATDMTDIERRACHAELRFRFPGDLGHPRYEVRNGAVHIPYGGTDARRCTGPDAAKVARALGCVVRKLDKCLVPINPDLATTMREFIFAKGRHDRHAFISCDGTCPGEIITAPYFPAANGTQIAAIELSQEVLARDNKTLCENVFHELMHAARVPAAADHDERGADRIYSCARVCSGCSHWSKGWESDQKDCAACAEPTRNKGQCGARTELTATILPDDPNFVCIKVAGGAVTFAPCVGRREIAQLYCDDTRSPATGACCDGCPEGFHTAGGSSSCDGFTPRDACQGPLWLCDV